MICIKSFYWLYPTGISGGGASGVSGVNGGMGIKTLSTNSQNQYCDFATYKDKSPDFSGLFCFSQEKNLFYNQRSKK